MERRYLKYGIKFLERNYKTTLSCRALSSSIFIDPYGNVFPCTIFDEELGNLKDFEYDIMKIIKIKKAIEVKNNIEKLIAQTVGLLVRHIKQYLEIF